MTQQSTSLATSRVRRPYCRCKCKHGHLARTKMTSISDQRQTRLPVVLDPSDAPEPQNKQDAMNSVATYSNTETTFAAPAPADADAYAPDAGNLKCGDPDARALSVSMHVICDPAQTPQASGSWHIQPPWRKSIAMDDSPTPLLNHAPQVCASCKQRKRRCDKVFPSCGLCTKYVTLCCAGACAYPELTPRLIDSC